LNSMQEKIPEVSVIVPISERHDNLETLYDLYKEQLVKLGKEFEFVFVIDGPFESAYEILKSLKKRGKHIKIVRFRGSFGESAALMEGFHFAKGKIILTLASYIQIEPEDLKKLFAAYDEGNDLVITRRYPRKDPLVNKIQSYVYHYIVKKLTGTDFEDITSGMRLINKKILHEFNLYGDLHRFIPIFARHRGIKVKEVKVSQRKEDTQLRLVKPGVYFRRGLDILTLFFLVKFTKKPLRFFGLIGFGTFFLGILTNVYLLVQSFLTDVAIMSRPVLLLGILLVVFGIQILSVGLIGELILYSHAKDIKEYHIDEIID